MIHGSNWPIPIDEMIDGAVVCLKNANRLTDDSTLAFDNGRYSTSISLSVLALEEMGKVYLLLDATSNNRSITKKIWNDEFESHTKKLQSLPNYLSTFVENQSTTSKKELERFMLFLKLLSKKKLESFYVDWNATKNNWFYFDDHETLSQKRKLATEALRSTSWLIKNHIKDMKDDHDLKFMITHERNQLLLQGKVHCFCNQCGVVLLNAKELLNHHRTSPSHLGEVSWHFNS